MAEENTPADISADNALDQTDGASSGTTTPAATTENGDSSIPVGGTNTIRSRGSKVSNLRAAFEQSAGAPPPMPPRSLSGTNPRTVSSDSEVSRLKEALAKEQEQREADRRRLDELQIEVEELREQSSPRAEDANTNEESSPPNGYHIDAERLALELHAARAQAQAYEDELTALRNQFSEVKRSIATNTRIETHEMTDSAFQGELGTLCYLVQDWVINSYRKAKVEKSMEEMCSAVDALDDKQMQEHLRPIFEAWDSSSKLVLLQSAIAALLLPVYQDPLPFGLPASVTWGGAIRSASEELQQVLDSVAYNRWRATTFDIICHSEMISPFVHSAANRITDAVVDTIYKICGITAAEAQVDALRNVMRRVIALSHSLRIQRATYDIELPLPGSSFDAAYMEGSGHDELPDQMIQCAIFPAVYKVTNASSKMVLFKARVSWKESWD